MTNQSFFLQIQIYITRVFEKKQILQKPIKPLPLNSKRAWHFRQLLFSKHKDAHILFQENVSSSSISMLISSLSSSSSTYLLTLSHVSPPPVTPTPSKPKAEQNTRVFMSALIMSTLQKTRVIIRKTNEERITAFLDIW